MTDKLCRCHAHGVGHAPADWLDDPRAGQFAAQLCTACALGGCDAGRPLPEPRNVVGVGETVQGMRFIRPGSEVVVTPDDVLVLVADRELGPEDARAMFANLPELLKGRVLVVPPGWTIDVARDLLKPDPRCPSESVWAEQKRIVRCGMTTEWHRLNPTRWHIEPAPEGDEREAWEIPGMFIWMDEFAPTSWR